MKGEVLLWGKSDSTTTDRVGLPTGKSGSRVILPQGFSCSRVSLPPGGRLTLEPGFRGKAHARARLPGEGSL